MDGSSANETVIVPGAIQLPMSPVVPDERLPHRRNKNVAFFAQDLSDRSTIKRVHQLLARGFTVTVFGFRRERYNIDFKPPWPHVLLGYTRDKRYLSRILRLFAAVPIIWAERSYLAHASVFYARNLDQLAMALIVRTFINRDATVVYEVLDIQPILAGAGLVSSLLRAVERLCLRHVRYLVLSSPGFFRHYYASTQGYKNGWLLLENKLSEACAAILRQPGEGRVVRIRPPHPGTWVIGYFGLIRGQATIDLITRVVDRLGDRVHFQFRGVCTTVDEARFRAIIASRPNMSYHGRFENPDDLPDLYGGVDFAWALDLENTDNNSRWLLPCRLYEAGYFGVPCLAVRGFEIGNRVEQMKIGWAFDAPFEDQLVHFFETLTAEQYDEKHRALLALSEKAFVSGTDVDALGRVLGDPDWAISERRSVQAAQAAY